MLYFVYEQPVSVIIWHITHMDLSFLHRRNEHIKLTIDKRQQPVDANDERHRLKLHTETYRNTYLLHKTKYTIFFCLGNSKEKTLKDSVLLKAEKENIFQSSKNCWLTNQVYSAISFLKQAREKARWGTEHYAEYQHTWMRSNKENSILTVVGYCWNNSSEQIHIALYDIEVSLSIAQTINCKHHNFGISWSRKIWKYKSENTFLKLMSFCWVLDAKPRAVLKAELQHPV